MVKKSSKAVIWMLLFGLLVCPVLGAEDNERIARLEAQLAAMQQELAALKQQQQQPVQPPAVVPADPKQIEVAVASYMEKNKTETPAIPDWIYNVDLNGDFRYRYEVTDDESRTADRHRNRIQARIGITGKVNPEVDFGFRIASGNNAEPLGDSEGSPTSNNQDLTNAFSSKNIWLDLAYFDYHPEKIEGLSVIGGKMLNPFYRVGNSDLMFDTDVTPEGIAVTYKTKVNDGLSLFGTAGGFYVQERSVEADTSLWAVQGGATWVLSAEKKAALTAGAGYYHYANIEGEEGLGLDGGDFFGNTNVGGLYASNFNLVQGFAEAGMSVGGLPVKVFADYLNNTQASSGEDTAYLMGASIGKCSKPGSWQFAYNYRDIEADSLIGVLADATFGGGGSNVKGHKFTLAYQLAENVQMAGNYMAAERTRDTTYDYDVYMLDLTFKF